MVLAYDGFMLQTHKHILPARQVSVLHVVVFVNKCEFVEDGKLLELVDQELRKTVNT